MQNIRHEMKVILDEVRLCEAQHWMSRSTQFREVYQVRTVNSLYFDDAAYSSLKDNLMGLAHRQKLRLRWYAESETKPFVSPKIEVKSRHGRVGSKATVPLTDASSDFLTTPYNQLFAAINSHLPPEHDLPLHRFFIPTMHVSYDRTYYETPNGLRLTIDNNINFYDPNQQATPATSLAHKYNRIIMELKFVPDDKRHVAKLLRSSNFTPQRHSKYVAGLANFGHAVYI